MVSSGTAGVADTRDTGDSTDTVGAAETTRVAYSPSHAAQLGGYDAARAAHLFEEFLEMRLTHDAFWEWLMCYPPHYGLESPDPAVEDQINHAILALLGFQHGTRSWPQVSAELRDARARLSGLARL
jgi:hypothetical protein